MKVIKDRLIVVENLRSMKAEAYKIHYEALERAKSLESRIFGELDQIREYALSLNWKEVKFCAYDPDHYMQWYKVRVSPEYFDTIKNLLIDIPFIASNPFEYDYSEGEYIVLEPYNQLSRVRFNEKDN